MLAAVIVCFRNIQKSICKKNTTESLTLYHSIRGQFASGCMTLPYEREIIDKNIDSCHLFDYMKIDVSKGT